MAYSLFLFHSETSHIAGSSNHVNMFRLDRSISGATNMTVSLVTSPQSEFDSSSIVNFSCREHRKNPSLLISIYILLHQKLPEEVFHQM
ncbi:hypothetical protein R6Q59_030235 [Mikania micrantha]